MARIQVLLDEVERERFREQAAREGVSLSAWLRQAGLERLRARQSRRIQSVRDLHAFFQAVDAREAGREPDWGDHQKVIERSRSIGQSDT